LFYIFTERNFEIFINNITLFQFKNEIKTTL